MPEYTKRPGDAFKFVNTQLRDYFTTLDLFCENFNVDRSELEAKLKSIDYEYSAATNQFV